MIHSDWGLPFSMSLSLPTFALQFYICFKSFLMYALIASWALSRFLFHCSDSCLKAHRIHNGTFRGQRVDHLIFTTPRYLCGRQYAFWFCIWRVQGLVSEAAVILSQFGLANWCILDVIGHQISGIASQPTSLNNTLVRPRARFSLNVNPDLPNKKYACFSKLLTVK